MPIDFNPTPAVCATYGYSFGWQCPSSGITHTVDQNWRMMLSPDGTTFYAPVTTVASIDASEGPRGDQGQTGMTGMTGATGMTGPRGPAGVTVDGAAINRLMYISDISDPEQTELTVFTATTVQKDDASGSDILRIQSVRENIPVTPTAATTSVTFDHAVSGNNVVLNLNASSASPLGTKVEKIHLKNLESGDYMTIICKQTANSPVADSFNSNFTASNSTDQTAGLLNLHFAGGITYGLGLSQHDVDVFYVQCINASAGASPTIDLLVNHQRYHV